MTLVTVTNTVSVVTVTDSGPAVAIPPQEFGCGVDPPIFNLTGHSIYAVSGGLTAYQFVIIDPADGTCSLCRW